MKNLTGPPAQPPRRTDGLLEKGESGFVVSHSSTIKLWMNGAQRFLVIS
jgi:hypothetical protein